MAVKGRKLVDLNYNTLLERVGEEDIYRYYLQSDFKLGKPFLSPFRRDTNPSFCINITKKGSFRHIDFGDVEKKGNCVQFVEQLFNLNYGEALLKIDKDLGLGIFHIGSFKENGKRSVSDEPRQKEEFFYQVTSRKFNKQELEYWALYYVDEKDLINNDIYAIKELLINRHRVTIRPKELIFGYWFDPKWKIYRPEAPKGEKFSGNVSNATMSGLKKITDKCGTVVVTKAKKDEVMLSKFLPCVCSVQSESIISINSSNISLLSSNCRDVYLNFDSDEVGVQTCKYYNQFGFKWINCPKGFTKPDGTMIKDFTDLARYHGLDLVKKYFESKGLI